MFKRSFLSVAALGVAVCFGSSTASAAAITSLDLTDSGDPGDAGEQLETTGSFAVDSLNITVTGTVGGVAITVPDEVSADSSGIGINAAAGSGDSASDIDDGEGTEALTFTFSKAVEILAIDFNAISGDEIATLAFGANPVRNVSTSTTGFSGGILTLSETSFASDRFLTAGQSLTFSLGAAGTSYGVEQIDLTPEPGTVVLLGLGSIGLISRRYRQHSLKKKVT